jgi:methylated-DNA-protein-cysteine methyltransferase-like protein
MPDTFSQRLLEAIRQIPAGQVATYGQLAAMAGNPRGARQVVRILHTSSVKEELPWHRVVNRHGGISLKRGQGYELQKALLEAEGVSFDRKDLIDLERYQWQPG